MLQIKLLNEKGIFIYIIIIVRMKMLSFFFPLFILVDDFSEESSFYEILPCCARFRCGELIVEGQWHHLVLVMSKGMLKNSTAALYIDGQLVNTVKVSILVLVGLNLLYKRVEGGVCVFAGVDYRLTFITHLNNMFKSHVAD